MRRPAWEVWFALVLVTTAAAMFAMSAPRYVASGAVLLPTGMVRAQFVAGDPYGALAQVQDFSQSHPDALFVDRPLLVRELPMAQAGVAAAALALAMLLLLLRRRQPVVRSERELTAVLGEALVAARPLAVRELSRQLGDCWFRPGRELLAVVSAASGEGRSRVSAELARAFAAAGAPTLLIDANLRAPRLHRAFGLRNRGGLADFLEGRRVRVARGGDNLSVLVAGRASEDPLELLSRKRLPALLAAAARRYRVVLVDTPAAAQGPDLQMFAALAGGALVVTDHPAQPQGLRKLRELLDPCRACVVGTVLSPT